MSRVERGQRSYTIRWLLVIYDFIVFAAASFLLFFVYKGISDLSTKERLIQAAAAFMIIFVCRLLFSIYRLVWRYGGIQSYIRMILSDFCAFVVYILLRQFIPTQKISALSTISLFCMTLLGSLVMRMIYRYAYKFGNKSTAEGKFLRGLLYVFSGNKVDADTTIGTNKINIAIVGAGRVGTSLATDLTSNANSAYLPRCFIDINNEKIGKEIYGLPVIDESDATVGLLARYEIQEIVFAIPNAEPEEKKALYEHYKGLGYKVKIYDYPTMRTAGARKQLREFDIDELLFRKEIDVTDEKTAEFYKDKVVMITGGGGSIGSELCRQVANMDPRRLVILDVAENGAYDIQQELKIGNPTLSVRVEIVSVCDREGLEKIFAHHRPNIVLHAAAHKHVPLMERNCIEAVKNNVFGTLNVVELCERYGAERFMMVSTDKAVNPTNVMGATKRMCEMIVQAHSTRKSSTTFSSTRFGNVLGSAGSVVPLFKKQIANGGPITLTDKRIIRYFMTIPEAASLVLQAGAMAKNGELFVLDMGQPVKILDLAENLIRLSGLEPYKDIDIIETGLRPGEKLYEELLVRDEGLGRTANKLIFVERDEPLPLSEIEQKLATLQEAIDTGHNSAVKEALKQVVPTYKSPEEVNRSAQDSDEFRNTKMFIDL